MKYLNKLTERTKNYESLGIQTYPPYHLEPRVPPSDPKHVCCVCHTGVRYFEVHDEYGIVSMVCSEECFNLWILKKT